MPLWGFLMTLAAPIACTLSARDMKTRMADIAALNNASLREFRRDDLALELIYAPEARERVLEMIGRERECCAFLTFDIREDADALHVVIRAPESARAGAEAVFMPFQSKRVASPGCSCCAGEAA